MNRTEATFTRQPWFSQLRDVVANDNVTEFEDARQRRAMREWATERMSDPAFAPMAWTAMCQAQVRLPR